MFLKADSRTEFFRGYAGLRTPSRQSLGFATFLVLVAFFLILGLVGHDPWKQDETYVFGIIQHLLDTGDWIVPQVAGEPFMEKPPLYYWVAAAFAWICSPWLQLHDGARLATGFFMALTSASLGWSARHWWGNGAGRYSVLVLLGCLGTVFYSHLMLTDIPLLTGFSVAICGFALALNRASLGGLLLGVGVGTGFLAKGMIAPAVLSLVALLLPICFQTWRSRVYFRAMPIALLTALPFLLIWPTALYLRSPALFMDWFWLNNIGRFFGFSVPLLGAPHTEGFWTDTLPWFTFPALPLALFTLWQQRRMLPESAPLQFSLLLSAVFMAVLAASASARSNYALPLLLPLCLLAAPAVTTLPSRVERIWTWGSHALFGTLAFAIWTIWVRMLIHGSLPPHLTLLSRYLPSNFKPQLGFNALVLAPALTLLIIWIAWRERRYTPGLLSWIGGITLCWGLIATLWLDWIDYAKSYRSVFISMHMAMPSDHQCIASRGLGESERAMLYYVLGVTTKRQELQPDPDCDLLLINGLASSPPKEMETDRWRLIWEGARPSDERERFWLFKAAPSPTAIPALAVPAASAKSPSPLSSTFVSVL